MSLRRWHRVVAATLAAVGAVLTLTAAPAQAATVYGTAKAPNGLTMRNGPGTGFGWVGSMAYNSKLPVLCYAIGESVNGNSYWDVVDNGSQHPPYVSDYWLDTGGDVTTRGIPSCRTFMYDETPGMAKQPGGLPVYDSPGAGPQGISLT
ncbi:hypothetical protein [Dactylosporangium sp. NPDC048998]|uniref:hypothetical protein n=1 Tax=Dactylosporangium sp. NPDC048998 TaxID=3363976 RepID=UPI003722E119